MSVSWLDEDEEEAWLPVTRPAPPARLWRHWHIAARSALPRVCCNCGMLIFPGTRHHRIEGRRGTRRVHYRSCPSVPEPAQPAEPAGPPLERAVESLNAWIAAACIAACGVALVLFMLIVGGGK